jgi:hypothetical protein
VYQSLTVHMPFSTALGFLIGKVSFVKVDLLHIRQCIYTNGNGMQTYVQATIYLNNH